MASMNPITSFISNHMEPAKRMQAEMTDRVAECSINAQRVVDERHGPWKYANYWQTERRSREFDHFFVAHSSLKADKEAGKRSSFSACRYYSDKAAERRDALLAKYNNNTKEE